ILLFVFVFLLQEKRCDFPEIKHGVLHNEYNYRRDFPVSVGKKYYYSCNHDFVTDKKQKGGYIHCTQEGWSPAIPCRRQCLFNYLINGEYPYPAKMYFQGDSVSVNCYADYSLQNAQTVMTCTEDGWAPAPECLPPEKASKEPVDIQHGNSNLKSTWCTQWGDYLLTWEHVAERQHSQRPTGADRCHFPPLPISINTGSTVGICTGPTLAI
uniref:Sushi domain-containing protein n=1 Tax=Panthera leo TaxID=9689 RepID=A0A8C9DAZ3_PANLE